MRVEQIGGATLYLGDCLEILPTLEKVDACITDPPYGIALSDHSQGGRHGKKRRAWEFEIVGDKCQSAGIKLLDWCRERRAPTVTFASPKRPWPGEWSSLLVWDKGPAVGGGGDTARCWKQTWELVQVARNSRLRGQRDAAVLRYWVTPDLSADHPAAKPVDLLVYLIGQTSDRGDVIFDPFMGSGTTGVACANLGRKFIGIEIEEKYFDIACERITAAQAQQRLFA